MIWEDSAIKDEDNATRMQAAKDTVLTVIRGIFSNDGAYTKEHSPDSRKMLIHILTALEQETNDEKIAMNVSQFLGGMIHCTTGQNEAIEEVAKKLLFQEEGSTATLEELVKSALITCKDQIFKSVTMEGGESQNVHQLSKARDALAEELGLPVMVEGYKDPYNQGDSNLGIVREKYHEQLTPAYLVKHLKSRLEHPSYRKDLLEVQAKLSEGQGAQDPELTSALKNIELAIWQTQQDFLKQCSTYCLGIPEEEKTTLFTNHLIQGWIADKEAGRAPGEQMKIGDVEVKLADQEKVAWKNVLEGVLNYNQNEDGSFEAYAANKQNRLKATLAAIKAKVAKAPQPILTAEEKDALRAKRNDLKLRLHNAFSLTNLKAWIEDRLKGEANREDVLKILVPEDGEIPDKTIYYILYKLGYLVAVPESNLGETQEEPLPSAQEFQTVAEEATARPKEIRLCNPGALGNINKERYALLIRFLFASLPDSIKESIETLKLAFLDLKELPDFQGFNNLKVLYISNNDIIDLSPLQPLQKLEGLWASNCHSLANLEPLKNLNNLRTLALGGTQVANLDPLRQLSRLTYLYLEQTRVTDLTPLRELKNLTRLFLQDCPQINGATVQSLRQSNRELEIVW